MLSAIRPRIRPSSLLLRRVQQRWSSEAQQYDDRWPPNHRSGVGQIQATPEQVGNKEIFVYNARNADGRSRSVVMTIVDKKGKPVLTMTKEEFEGFMKVLPTIKEEFIAFNKKKR
mmetsp:Transcript_49726/g.106549  ORF Transcript_49726/g.106549 Transcript_49726/m.106549 type:complete len:115 (+) Transcript_49726:14-358(+)